MEALFSLSVSVGTEPSTQGVHLVFLSLLLSFPSEVLEALSSKGIPHLVASTVSPIHSLLVLSLSHHHSLIHSQPFQSMSHFKTIKLLLVL